MWYRTAKPKYGNTKIQYAGRLFDSKREVARYKELETMQRAGKIYDLKCQVKYELIPAQYDQLTGKCIFRATNYYADFTYYTDNGNYVVEDAKGYQTDVYKMKKKMMLFNHGILIQEV